MSASIAMPTAAEYAQLRDDAALVDRSDRLRMRVTGMQAAATLSGLVTSDVMALQSGHGQYAAALTARGKVIADLRIFFRTPEDLLIDVSAAAASGFTTMLRKYVNPRFARVEDVSAAVTCLGVAGPHARQVVAHALNCSPAAFDLLPPYAHSTVPFGDDDVLVARAVDYGIDGFDCFTVAAAAVALRDALVAAGAALASPAALEVLRIEAGRPAWGTDMDGETLAQEAGLDALDAISFTKGCYTGQEVVARVHFRGHVNRQLQGLHLTSPAEAGAQLYSTEMEVGIVRSCAVSPRLGPIALAMLRREVEPGSVVTVRSLHGDASATVVALPFPA